MQPTIFGAFVALLGIWCQFGAFRRTVIAMMALTVFGAVAALDLPAVGGASVTPANFFLLFFMLRLVSMRDGATSLVAEIAPRRPLFVFFLLIIWIMSSAILMPRLFDGATSVFSLSRAVDLEGGTTPLHATSGNLSQAVYAVGGFMVACGMSVFARRPGGSKAILSGLVFITSLDLGFAVLDIVTSATHTGFILDLIHTASYAFLTDDELGGLKRLSGSFSEASAFATFSLTMLGVNFALFVQNIRPRFTGPASLLLTAFVALSTSSAGYAGLAVFYGLFFLYAFAVGAIHRRRRVVVIAVGTICAGILAVAFVLLFVPAIVKIATAVITESLLTKGTSDSGIERGSWNTQALQVFQDTYWLGAGIGSTRASNYALVLLSNLGAIGFGLFAVLLLRITLGRVTPAMMDEERGIVWAARIGILVTLVPSLLVGTVYDLGTMFYILVGIAASGVPSAAPHRSVAADVAPRRRGRMSPAAIGAGRTARSAADPRAPGSPASSRSSRRSARSSTPMQPDGALGRR